MHQTRRFIALALSLTVLLTGCQQSPEAKKPIKKSANTHWIVSAPVSSGNLTLSRQSTGSLRAKKTADIYSQEEGRLTDYPFYEGDSIHKGDILARLEDNLLKAQLTRATALRHQLEKDLTRLKTLSKKQLTSVEELGSKETELAVAIADENILKTHLAYTVIRSPVDGVIVERLSEPGNIVEKHAHLLTVSDLSTLITEVPVSELLLANLSIGDTVTVFIDALSQSYQGSISRIHPNIDPTTRRGVVEVTLPDVPKGARPGQFCRITFSATLENRLSIPFRALQYEGSHTYVYRLVANKEENTQSEKTVEKQTVKTGARFEERIEILSGITLGDQIVTRGFMDLRPGKQVTEATSPLKAKSDTSQPSVN